MGIINLRNMVGLPAIVANEPKVMRLFLNLCRLTDKALREYDAARAELPRYGSSDRVDVSAYCRGIDHLENCVSAAHRAVLNTGDLRGQKIGRAAPQLTKRQKDHLKDVRDLIEHSNERIMDNSGSPKRPKFEDIDPVSIRPAATSLVIGAKFLTYRELVAAITKCHRVIEIVLGVSAAEPSIPHAVLRTDSPTIVLGPGVRNSEYLKEIMRLRITHT
jgi:hypothetical protein